MNNQTILLLAMGLFAALLVAVVAVDQYLLDKHPPSEVHGLLWRIENAFDRVRDLEATIQITHEEDPSESLRMKVMYVKGPPPVLSMRYLRPQETNDAQFAGPARDEAFTVEGDLMYHYLPRENVIITRRWIGFPLISLGLSAFNVTQLRADWIAGRTDIRIVQPVTGFTSPETIPSITGLPSFAHDPSSVTVWSTPLERSPHEGFSLCAVPCPDHSESQDSELSFTYHPEQFTKAGDQIDGLRVAYLLDAQPASPAITRSTILEVRDADTQELVRMVWVDRRTYLVQKVITFTDGKRDTTLVLHLLTVDQGLSADDVVGRPQPGVPTIRG